MKIQNFVFLLLIPCFAFIQQLQSPNEGKFSQPPKTLFSIDKSITKFSWTTLVANHYDYFSSKAKNREGDTTQLAVRECVASMFGAVNGWVYPLGYNGARDYPSLFKKDTYISIVKKFYSSPKAQIALYNWIKPTYMDAFKQLPKWKKRIYKDMLAHLKKYINEFNYNAELKRFEDSKTIFKPNSTSPTPSFTYMGPKGLRGSYGKMEAFVFRRIYNKDLTLEQIKQWVNTFEKDFNLIK